MLINLIYMFSELLYSMLLILFNINNVKVMLLDCNVMHSIVFITVMYLGFSMFVSLSMLNILILVSSIWFLFMYSTTINFISYENIKGLFRFMFRMMIKLFMSLFSICLTLMSKLFRFVTLCFRFLINLNMSKYIMSIVGKLMYIGLLMFDWIKMLVQTYLLILLSTLYINENKNKEEDWVKIKYPHHWKGFVPEMEELYPYDNFDEELFTSVDWKILTNILMFPTWDRKMELFPIGNDEGIFEHSSRIYYIYMKNLQIYKDHKMILDMEWSQYFDWEDIKKFKKCIKYVEQM